MNKKAIVKKVMEKLEAAEIPIAAINRLIDSIRKMKNSDDIYKTLHRTLTEYHFPKHTIQETLSRLMSKEKLQKISPAHDHALKKIVKDFGGDYYSFK